MKMTSNIANALPIVAAAYGRKFGVQVQVGGANACTDGRTITIPEISDDPLARTLAWGYLTHEAAHVRETNFGACARFAAKGPLFGSVLNVLEDVRIENAIMRPYPGARSTLDAVMTWLVAQGMTAAPKEEDSPPAVLGNALLVLSRYRYRRQEVLEPAAQEAERVLRKTFPSTFVHRLLGLMSEIPGLRSTWDAAGLAGRIIALAQQEAQEPPPAPSRINPSPPSASDDDGTLASERSGNKGDPDENGPGGRDGNDGSAEDESGDNDVDGTNQGGPANGTGACVSQGQGRDQRQTGEGSAGRPDGDGAGGEGGDGRQALQAVLSAGEGDVPGDLFAVVARALTDQRVGGTVPLLPTLEQYQGHAALGRDAVARVRAASARLTARLRGLVESHTMTQVRTVRRGRVLSPTHLHRIAVGDARVFRRKEQKVAPNTALHVLVDLSGSMGRGADRIALDASMSLALALEPLRGVSCAVTAFPSLRGGSSAVTRILSHGDRMAARAGAFVQHARGGTPMTGALWYAAADLLARREERKVIVTLTDGGPDDWSSARAMGERASAAGLELIGVGIGIAVDRLFPLAIRIDGVADLKGELFRIAEQLLLK